jgi:uncharacterized membrane protein
MPERHQQAKNLSQAERIASAIGGAALFAYGVQKRSLPGLGLAALGGALFYRGLTGHCHAYRALGVNTAGKRSGRNVSIPYETGIRVDHTVVIARSPDEVYQFWRNLENLPRFMGHLQSVQEIDNKHSHWVAKAPAGMTVEWKAEIINEVPNQLIGWRSLKGADVDNAGSVHFTPTGAGTRVRVSLQYNPPGGAIGSFFAKLFGEEPSQQIADDFQRLKQILEGGFASAPRKQPTPAAGAKGWNRDAVGSASEESFPASDPPSWTPEALAH